MTPSELKFKKDRLMKVPINLTKNLLIMKKEFAKMLIDRKDDKYISGRIFEMADKYANTSKELLEGNAVYYHKHLHNLARESGLVNGDTSRLKEFNLNEFEYLSNQLHDGMEELEINIDYPFYALNLTSNQKKALKLWQRAQ